MDDESLGDWMLRHTDILRRHGLEGGDLKRELRRAFWSKKRDSLRGMIAEAQHMEEAWRVGGELLQQELDALTAGMYDILDPTRTEDEKSCCHRRP